MKNTRFICYCHHFGHAFACGALRNSNEEALWIPRPLADVWPLTLYRISRRLRFF